MRHKNSKSNGIIEKVEVLSNKRQRTLNRTDTVATTWILEHLEECEQPNFSVCDAYENYLNWCRESNRPVLLKTDFAKVIKKLFQKGFSLKTSSPLYALVNIRVNSRKPLRQSDSTLRLEKAILGILKQEENPSKGMRISSIKNHLTTKFPMESFDAEALKKFLEARVDSGVIQQVKSTGKVGLYRLNTADSDNESNVMENIEDYERNQASDLNNSYNSENNIEADEEKTSGSNFKETKQKITQLTRRLNLKKKGAIIKKEPKKTASKKASAYKLIHSKPTRAEDTFPMAMCFCCEPKLTSISKICNYLERFYNISLTKNKLMNVLNRGVGQGYWSKATSKSTILDKIQLEISSFNPSNDNDLMGKIINAILACNEPKECSVRCLKQYVDEFHPNFNITKNSLILKRALKNAEEKGLIKRMSGTGATGTFRLKNSFTPSPVQLAGNDMESDYNDDTNGSNSIGQTVYCDVRKPRKPISRTSSNEQSKLRAERKMNSSKELLRNVRSSKKIKEMENYTGGTLKSKSDIKKELAKVHNVSIKTPKRILRVRPTPVNRNKSEALNSEALNRRRGRSAARKQNL
ncbi:DgyrCDS6254 [Dimorphilus gyrociliatus]|uniref:DgyrCDS6254 n=1 Tax=Dimorphilus gyrociliatus TaxID=2664684 RepID=A0A7I8VMH7_9ANNE|nr:DgyrCDS6254 [Dimorphilus gyrociliatus]